MAKVRQRVEAQKLPNVVCLPYQPVENCQRRCRRRIACGRDGRSICGTIHPCKIYNALAVGAPILYLGPENSHVADILNGASDPSAHISVRHGEARKLAEGVLTMSRNRARLTEPELNRTAAICSPRQVVASNHFRH